MNNENYPNWLVPLEIAKELKKIGFNEPCHFYFLYYHGWEILKKRGDEYGFITSNSCRAYVVEKHNEIGNLSVPTWEQVFEWFREKGFDSYIGLESLPYPDEGVYYYFEILKPTLYSINQLDCQGDFDDYNEAREVLVKTLIQTYKREQYKIK